MNDKAVYRTAPATPGLLNTIQSSLVGYRSFRANSSTDTDPYPITYGQPNNRSKFHFHFTKPLLLKQ